MRTALFITRTALLITFLVCLSRLASAEPPANISRTEQLSRVATFPVGVKIYAPTTLRPVTTAPAGGVSADAPEGLWCFDFGSVVRVGCDQRVDIFLVQTTTLSFSAGALVDTRGNSTLGNLVGPVSGKMLQDTIPAGGWVEYVVPRTELYSDKEGITGFRGGYCTGNATTVNWPCGTDTDCGTSGTCNGPTAARQPKCAFVVLKAVTTAGTCTVANPR